MIGKEGQPLPMGLQAGKDFAPKPAQIVLGQFLGTLLLHVGERLADGRIDLPISQAAHAGAGSSSTKGAGKASGPSWLLAKVSR